MPRPRSSTFYLPLAPIDAPLELKAKLSVLPPSAANALLAPRIHYHHPQRQQQSSNGGLPHNNHAGGGGCGFGFSRSTGTTTGTGTNNASSINNTSNGNNGNNGNWCGPQEDECTRLNRVLGIPTSSTNQTQHTHIVLPETTSYNSNSNNSSPHSSTCTSSSSLGVPSSAGIGRRRHTDAPKPSFPISRTSPTPTTTRSPLLPTPVPSENTGTGYFSTWGNSDWRHALTSQLTTPAPAPALSGLPTPSGLPALSESQAERVIPSSPPGLGLPSISETDTTSDTYVSASIPADNQNGSSSSAGQRPQTTLSVSAPAPAPVSVPDGRLEEAKPDHDRVNDRVIGGDNDRVNDGNNDRVNDGRVGQEYDGNATGNGERETEVSMVWNITPSIATDDTTLSGAADATTPSETEDGTTSYADDEWNTRVSIGSRIGAGAGSTIGPAVRGGHDAVDMDVFAGACEVRNPVVQREVDPPRASTSSNLLWRTPSPVPTTTIPSLLSSSTTRTSPVPTPPASTPAEVRPTPTPVHTRAPLSYIPCGMHHVLACRTKVRSRFAPSPSPQQSRGPSRPCTAVHASRPSTSSSFSIASSSSSTTSITSSTTTTSTRSTSSSTSIILTSKLAIRPPPCDSLHPNDTRHLLRPQFRLSFPPPPAPLASAKDAHPREEACMFIDESIPGLADINATFVSTGHNDHGDPSSASQESTYISSQDSAYISQPKLAPRQRFRLAPSYLPRVLRRSLGASAWARAETLSAARAIERGFGWGAPGMMNGAVCSNLPPNFNTGAGAWPSAFAGLDGMDLGPHSSHASSTGSAWWQSANGVDGHSECSFSNSLVWSGYEDVYSEEDMEMADGDEMKEESIWDWDDEDVEPVMVQGQERHEVMDEDEDEFVREGAPEPEERPLPSDYSPQSSPSYSIQTPSTPSDPNVAGYSMVGKFGWDTTWPASPTSPVFPAGREATHFQSIDIPGLDVTPITLGLPPVHRRTVRREDGAEDEDEEEIFRYSPLDVEEDQGIHGRMDVEGDDAEGVQIDYLHTQTMSSCSTPTATSPSFPPGPLRGVTISSSFDDGYLLERTSAAEQVEDNQEFYDADGDAEMEETPVRNVTMSRPPIRAPRPLSLVQHPVLHHQYREDACSPPPSSVFIIPPSPLTTTTFDAGNGTGSSTPTSATAPAPMFPDRMEEEGDLSNVGWPTSTSVEHSLSPKRSYERIVAPRPQRVSRALEQVFTASTSSPVYRTSSLAQSPPPPGSPPSSSSSPRWTFGSLKSALSNSMSHLVELARSRSPSPLPWLMRGSAGYTGATLSGVAAALDSHRRDGSEEELESERSTSCVTPTPAAGSHSRRSSTTTITGASTSRRAEASSSSAHLPVLKLQVDPTSADAMMSESPPPKRTLSTSSLSSLGSEPDSESGSSGGIFSRSPSPEPTSDTRIWDPSYTLTPRSRPISADAKAAAACGGRLSPMMIPGSWDPAELWVEEGDLAKTW